MSVSLCRSSNCGNNNHNHNITDELECLKNYLATFQVCKKCRTCFQNHVNIYQGTTPLCKHCRKNKGVPIVVVRYNIIEYIDNSTIPRITSQQFAIPMETLSKEMLLSLNYLDGTTIRTNKIYDETLDIFRFVNQYENQIGSLFHETFPSKHILAHYSPLTHTVIHNFEYCKEIHH